MPYSTCAEASKSPIWCESMSTKHHKWTTLLIIYFTFFIKINIQFDILSSQQWLWSWSCQLGGGQIVPLIPIAIFLALNSEEIPRTVVNKKGTQLSFIFPVDDDGDDDPLVEAILSSFCRLAGGDFSNSSLSSSVSES